jgi:hypothetical protein
VQAVCPEVQMATTPVVAASTLAQRAAAWFDAALPAGYTHVRVFPSGRSAAW